MPCSVLGSLINPGPFVSLASYRDSGLASLTDIGLASGIGYAYTDLGIGHTCTDCGTGTVTSLNSLTDIGLATYADIGHFFTNFDSGLDTRSVLGAPHWFSSSLGGLLRLA